MSGLFAGGHEAQKDLKPFGLALPVSPAISFGSISGSGRGVPPILRRCFPQNGDMTLPASPSDVPPLALRNPFFQAEGAVAALRKRPDEAVAVRRHRATKKLACRACRALSSLVHRKLWRRDADSAHRSH